MAIAGVDGNAVFLDGVCLDIGGKRILSEISWHVARGEKWVILGLNGSGKTSLLRLLSGFGYPSCGAIQVLGKTVRPHRPAALAEARGLGIWRSCRGLPGVHDLHRGGAQRRRRGHRLLRRDRRPGGAEGGSRPGVDRGATSRGAQIQHPVHGRAAEGAHRAGARRRTAAASARRTLPGPRSPCPRGFPATPSPSFSSAVRT